MSLNNFDQLIIHPGAKRFLEAYLKNLTHSLLLTGTVGVGLGTIAAALARRLAKSEVVTIQPSLHAQQKTANINIDDIRSIQPLLATKRQTPLVVVIDEIDQLTAGTPETLLKILEEPVQNLYFILTTHNLYNIPPTITSRSQIINCLPTTTDQLLADIKPPTKRRQVEFMASGYPAEITRLIEDDDYFRAQARLFEIIKKFISASPYQRLIITSQLKTRPAAIDFVQNLAKVTVLTAPKTGKTDSLRLLSDIIERLHQNGNLKAQLTYLALSY